jgi:putative Mg2+ transporter-C (MgtC) family protein
MSLSEFQAVLANYWSGDELTTNLLVFMNLAGALLLGGLVGYERSYHGRAAGMRTYGLVCMASAGLTVISGYPAFWYGGGHGVAVTADPTRVVQGIVTGIGFLGAGVIMKEGLSISGLTTAASIWAASAIGVLIGVGFYASAMLLAGLSAATMMWGSRIEAWLPSHHALGITLRFAKGATPPMASVCQFLRGHSYDVAPGSLSIGHVDGRTEWRFVSVVIDRRVAATLDTLARDLATFEPLESFSLSHARN